MLENTVINRSLVPRCSIRILVVDDEKDIVFVLKRALEKCGFMVDAFDKPESALTNFRLGLYDLIITDLSMPKMSGFELYQEIRKIDVRAKICFLTANESYSDELKTLSPAEAKCFIKKPVSMDSLLKIVKDELES